MKAWKIILPIGITVLVIGIVVFIIGLSMNGWDLTVEYTMNTYVSQEENTSLDLGLSAGEMKVEFYDGDAIEVNYPDSPQFGYTVSESKGTLSVTPKTNFFLWFGWRHVPAVTVKIPRGKVVDLELDMSAGTATIADGEFGDFKTSMSAGWLKIGEIECKKYSSENSAGNLEVGALKCVSSSFDMSAGAITVNKLTSDHITVDLSAGSASFTVAGSVNEYRTTVNKSAGSCNLPDNPPPPGSSYSGKLIDVDLSAGSVHFNFTD